MRDVRHADPDGLFALIHRRPIVPRLLCWAALAMSLGLLWGRFHDLDLGDFVDWDESLYAWRAKVAVLDGAWLDQSHYTYNGFYSGAFPPLLVWQMAAMFKLVGFEEWAARFPVAVMGCLALLGLGWCGWVLGGPGVGLLALMLLGIVSYFARYSTMAQFDVPTVAWMVLILAAYLESVRSEHRRRLWVYLCGVFLGLGLMTKIALPTLTFLVVVGSQAIWLALGALAPAEEDAGNAENPASAATTATSVFAMPAALSHVIRPGNWRRFVADDLIIAGTSAAVWLPWHGYMYLQHGQTFWNWYIGYHLLERHTAVLDAHAGEWWFYLHAAYYRLPSVMHGLGLASAVMLSVLIVMALLGSRRGPARRTLCLRAAAAAPVVVWMFLLLVILQTSSTKREVYLLMVYPAVALAIAVYVVDLSRFAPHLVHQCLSLALLLGFEAFWHRRARADSVWLLMMGEMHPPPGSTVASEILLLARGSLGLGLATGALLPLVLLGVDAAWRRLRGPGALRLSTLIVQVGVAGVALYGIGRDAPGAMLKAVIGSRVDAWTYLHPWLNHRERYPRLGYAGVGTETWPSYMYYLNGNIPESRPSINQPIVRVNGIDAAMLAMRERGLDALIVERSIWSDHLEMDDPFIKDGFRRTLANDRFLIYEPSAP